MEIMVDLSKPKNVEVGLTGIRQLAQELRTLLITSKGSVPLDRDFGVSWNLIDSPLPEAKQLLISDIASQIERYIPRLHFKSIEFPDPGQEKTIEGMLQYKVTVTIREEYIDEFRES